MTESRYPAPGRLYWSWLAVLLLPIFAMVMATLTGQANAWALVNFGMLLVFWAIAVVAHEAGHAVAAHIQSFDVHWISIGAGPRLGSFDLGGIRVLLHLIPFSGAVLATTSKRDGFRRRMRLFISMGPIVNVVLAGIGYLVARHSSRAIMTEACPAAVFAFANLLAMRQALLPGSDRGKMNTDHDLVHLNELVRATEAQLEQMFQSHRAENERWSDRSTMPETAA